jgi:hypothetical protein
MRRNSLIFVAGLLVIAALPVLAAGSGPERAANQTSRHTATVTRSQVSVPSELAGQRFSNDYVSGGAAIARSQRTGSTTTTVGVTDLGGSALPSHRNDFSVVEVITRVGGRMLCVVGSVLTGSGDCFRTSDGR